MSDVTRDRISGNLDEAKGSVKENVGEAIGNEQMQGEGKVDGLTGKIKQGVADLKEKVDDVVGGQNDADKRSS